MASCNMCRNGYTALQRRCPNWCEVAPSKDVLERLNTLAHLATTSVADQEIMRDAIGEIVRLRITAGESM